MTKSCLSKYFLLCLLTAFSFETGCAQSNFYQPDFFEVSPAVRKEKMKPAFAAIQKLYEDYAKENHVPGIAFGIVSAGELIYAGGVGVQNVQTGQKATSSSVFRIASMTKSFTAMAILKLRDAGKLDLDEPVTKYVPELMSTSKLASDSRAMTIRNLLTHTAGFPEDNPWADRQLDKTNAELVSFIKSGVSMAYIPGQAYEYSNLGFALLGLIITRVSGQTFDEYISTAILQPLNMHHTYWEYSKVPSKQLVLGYRLINGKWNEEELLHSGAFGSTGGLLTSVEDFSKYMQLQLSAWPANNQSDSKVVARGTIREMHGQGVITRLRKQNNSACPIMYSYNDGLAWAKDCSGKLTIQHSGGLPGFGSHWSFMPDYDIAVVALTNLTYSAPDVLNAKVLDTLIQIAGLQRRVVHTSSILEQRQKQLIQILPGWVEAEKTGIFSGNFFKDYFIEDLKAQSGSLFKEAGKIVSVSEMVPVNQLRGYFTLTGETGALDVWFTLSPENPALIQEFKISKH